MPATKNGQAIKNELLRIITENIGSKTAGMYRDFYDEHTAEVALASAEELLAEFVGRDRARHQIVALRAKFSLTKSKSV